TLRDLLDKRSSINPHKYGHNKDVREDSFLNKKDVRNQKAEDYGLLEKHGGADKEQAHDPSSYTLPRSKTLRHDRLRNHKEPISQEGFEISLGDGRANHIGRRAARAYGAAAQVGGTRLWAGVSSLLVLHIGNMAPRGTIAMTTVLLCFILGLLGPTPAALGSHMGKACCTRYNRKPVPFQRIKGFREQTTKENCHIEAIIFYTVKKHEICATRRDEWVRKTLELLRYETPTHFKFQLFQTKEDVQARLCCRRKKQRSWRIFRQYHRNHPEQRRSFLLAKTRL
ncbi:hypothetical protein FQN60_016096, partial [Etheostoma spectabile]